MSSSSLVPGSHPQNGKGCSLFLVVLNQQSHNISVGTYWRTCLLLIRHNREKRVMSQDPAACPESHGGALAQNAPHSRPILRMRKRKFAVKFHR